MKTIAKGLFFAAATMGLGSAANATVTLVNGDNSLTTQIHLDPNADNSNVLIVQGLTQPGGIPVSFSSTAFLDGTGGNGYAQIADTTNVDNLVFNNLNIYLTNGGGFTGYEFTIMFDPSRTNPDAFLTISYDLLGGGSGSFSYDPNAPNNSALNNLDFTNNGARDFRLSATGGDIITQLRLTTDDPIVQVKQNDIQIAPGNALPEPSTWAMMLFGFGAIGVSIRRSRKKGLTSQLA